MLSYITAYYKVNYPKEFIAASLTTVYKTGGDAKKRQQKLDEIIKDCKRLGIQFLPIDINHSKWNFTIEDNKIRIGLCSIPSFSLTAYEEIINIKTYNMYPTVIEYIHNNVEKKKCSKRGLVPLILSGALGDRIKVYQKYCEIRKEEMLSSIFIHKTLTIDLYAEDIEVESDLIGVPYTTSPINNMKPIGYSKIRMGSKFNTEAIVTRVSKIKDKNGEDMCFVSIDTGDGSLEAIMFSDIYRRHKKLLKKNKIIKFTGKKQSKTNCAILAIDM